VSETFNTLRSYLLTPHEAAVVAASLDVVASMQAVLGGDPSVVEEVRDRFIQGEDAA
jgi:hypothetical protein